MGTEVWEVCGGVIVHKLNEDFTETLSLSRNKHVSIPQNTSSFLDPACRQWTQHKASIADVKEKQAGYNWFLIGIFLKFRRERHLPYSHITVTRPILHKSVSVFSAGAKVKEDFNHLLLNAPCVLESSSESFRALLKMSNRGSHSIFVLLNSASSIIY